MAQLTTAEFQALMTKALAHFTKDWTRLREDDPGLFPDAQPDHTWWEAFAEFAQAEIVNGQRLGLGDA